VGGLGRAAREFDGAGPLPPFCKISGIIGLAGNSRQDIDVKELRY